MYSLERKRRHKFNQFLLITITILLITKMTQSFPVGDTYYASDTSIVALIPSQVIFSNASMLRRTDKGISRHKSPRFHTTLDADTKGNENNFVNDRKSNNNKRKVVREGNFPDLEWRAIPMDHLRCHPFFNPLPIPEDIQDINTIEDVRYFRQGTPQWDALHRGRCTTSQLSAALGFLEPKAGLALGIPRSLQHGPMSAYQRLGEKPLATLEDIKNALFIERDEFTYNIRGMNPQVSLSSTRIWKKMDQTRYPFAAKYNPKIYPTQLQARRRTAIRNASNTPSQAHRMIWGNTQEATAILTAVNYVSRIDPGVMVHETGMCGAGLEINSTASCNRLLVGASPDAIIQYSNGSLEALEVKNHCPFVPSRFFSADNRNSQYRLRELPLNPTVPSAYLPQLMMEIMCLGPKCSSAMMVRQTATSGAVILRVHRDDAWIQEMLYWLQKFVHEYVSKKVNPPTNFFWDDHVEANRYRKFVYETKRIAESVELVSYINNNSIQRVTADSGQLLPLFLD